MELKKNLLWVFAIIGMVAVGASYTVYVDSLQEAQTEFQRNTTIEKFDCVQAEAPEQVMSGNYDANTPITVMFKKTVSVNGDEQESFDEITVSASANQTQIDNAIKAKCDQQKTRLQQEQVAQEKTVIVRYGNLITDRVYDAIKGTWSTGSVQQIG